MQGTHLFEYAVIRVVPKVEREEFFNVGVILYCAGQRFLQSKFTIDEERLRSFCSKLELSDLQQYLFAFEKIARGESDSGQIGKLPIAERFRWLTATRSTIVQTSRVHPGFCEDAQVMLDKLHAQLVL
jgi:hypothetical protein